jgi:hypothetical protein
MGNEEVKFEKFYGELGVKSVDEIENSEDKMLVFADDTHLRVGKCHIDLVLTDEPSTSTEVRNKIAAEVVKECMTSLLKWKVKLIDLEHIFLSLNTSINESQRLADNKVYGKNAKYELSISDLDEIIKR